MPKKMGLYEVRVRSWSAKDGRQIGEDKTEGRRAAVRTRAIYWKVYEVFLSGCDKNS